MTAKGTDEEDKLNNDDNLKNSTSTSKSWKSKSEFTNPAISIQFSSYIQTQLTNSISIVKLSSSTSSQFKLNISFYWDSITLMLTLKHKNTDMF